MPVDWWVELNLGLLVGSTVPRGMSRGGCGVRKSSDSPSADEWAVLDSPSADEWPVFLSCR